MPTVIDLAKKDEKLRFEIDIHLDNSEKTKSEFKARFTKFLKQKNCDALKIPTIINQALQRRNIVLTMQALIEIEKHFGLTTGDIRKQAFSKLQEDIFVSILNFFDKPETKATSTINNSLELEIAFVVLLQQAQKRIIGTGKFGITKTHWSPDKKWEPQKYSHFLKTCDALISLLGHPDQILNVRLRPSRERDYESKYFPLEFVHDTSFNTVKTQAKTNSQKGPTEEERAYAEDKTPARIIAYLINDPSDVSIHFRAAVIQQIIPDEKVHITSVNSQPVISREQNHLKLLVNREELLGNLFARPEALRRLQLDKTALGFLIADVERNPYLLNELYFLIKEGENSQCYDSLKELFSDCDCTEKLPNFVTKFPWLTQISKPQKIMDGQRLQL